MKKITGIISALLVVLVFICCAAQKGEDKNTMNKYGNGDYDSVWKTIDSLDQKGLPKSALAEVEKLYERVKDKNEPSTIWRCLVYKGKYFNQLEEDGYYKGLALFEAELKTADFPLQPLLQSSLAELYFRELESKSWQIKDRTELSNPDANQDIQTWTTRQFLEKSKALYLASLKDPRIQEVSIDNFDEITTAAINTDEIRPKLYDFLAHRALDYFSNGRSFLTEPVYKFYLKQEEAFWEVNRFVNHTFTTKDEDSGVYQALLLFQDILKKHQGDKDKTALIDADIKRINFVYQNSTLAEKESTYMNRLKAMDELYKNHPASAEIKSLIANRLFNSGRSYSPNPDAKGKEDLIKAMEYCESGIKAFPNSFGAEQCKSIKSRILSKRLELKTGKVNVSGENFLAHLTFQNVTKVWLRAIPISDAQYKRLRDIEYDKVIDYLNGLDPAKSWSVDLPNEKDYLLHTTEVKVDELPKGKIILMASDNSSFSWEKNSVCYLTTHISNLSYFQRKVDFKGFDFFVTERNSGKPIADATVEYYTQKQRGNYEWIKGGELKTDKEGYAFMPGKEQRSVRIIIKKGDDILDLEDQLYYYKGYRNKKRISTQFFLDRKIYRPGQTVYFKALVTEANEKMIPSILANHSVKIEFIDANRQVVAVKDLRTNEFGTVNGNFTAPRIGLLGSMNLRSDANGGESFRVEEYKRPKFEVKFDPVKESFKLNDQVKITGQAKAFAGSNIDGAQVQYRVVRNISYPYFPWWRWSYWRPQRPSTEIINGTTSTDAEGKFTIEFPAKPDESSNPKFKPQFDYQVSVDVTDISGETRSGSANVSVGYVAMKVDITIPESINQKEIDSLLISTKNLNGEFEPAKGSIKIEQLQAPKGNIRKKNWKETDTDLYTETQYREFFPKDAYGGEAKKENWKVERTAQEASFNTANNKSIALKKGDLTSGHYVLTLSTQDKYGTDIELKKYFQVFNAESNEMASQNTALIYQAQNAYEVGETAKIYFGTSYPKQAVLYEVEHQNEIITRKWLSADQIASEQIKIVEAYRGNIHYAFTYVKDNRAYQERRTLVVPWSNKDLQIEYATFRDKLKPGQEEKWQIKVSGKQKEKFAAEAVAAMYDASLDAFAPNRWSLNLFPTYYSSMSLQQMGFGTEQARQYARNWNDQYRIQQRRNYRNLNWFGFSGNYGYAFSRGSNIEMEDMAMAPMRSGKDKKSKMRSSAAPAMEMAAEADMVMANEAAGTIDDGGAPPNMETEEKETDFSEVSIRTNLKETVFFMPDLKTDADGNVILEFTMNEALTRWKFLFLAHTKDLKSGISQKEIVTQKELMVMPNAPRFLREGDIFEFSAKVSNLSEGALTGTAKLELLDAITNQPINELLGLKNAEINFTAEAGQSAPLFWKLNIPTGKVQAITHRVIAKATNTAGLTFSDGEEDVLPVMVNRMLVTESMPLPVRGGQTKTFDFKRMQELSTSSTLQNHKLTLEYTSNPAWYAVQALPYLMEYPYDCTEQIFSRFYANSLASSVANAHPKIKSVFDSWKNTDALLSNLEKNQDLKAVILEETPWLLDAQNEAQQKKNIGLLFDLTRMAEEQNQAAQKIAERQNGDGGFSWFPGGRSNTYISQYIVEGLGHLKNLGVKVTDRNDAFANAIPKSIQFMDNKMVERYKWIKKHSSNINDDHLRSLDIHYLYARSFFLDQQMKGGTQDAYNYFIKQAEKFWLNKGTYQEGMIALALFRNGKDTAAKDIIKSLKERSLQNEEMGMYWKLPRGYYWYEHPIETQALMIEAFREITLDVKAVEEMRIWLLKNKQTNAWKTTKATAAAVYSLLIDDKKGSIGGWLLEDNPLQVSLGDLKIEPKKEELQAGTGYYKTNWRGEEIKASMAKVKITNDNKVIAWGGLYWQYFEQLDKITTFEDTPLQMKKAVFKEVNSDRGSVLEALEDGAVLNPGDKMKVRIELRVDRGMEYVHMKDMRGSGFEPINVLSSYKYQGGLGYYESTKDISTNFFIDFLPKGTYVFEYPLRVTHKGDFSNGITSIQCMYAPEFSSHSEGIRLKVE